MTNENLYITRYLPNERYILYSNVLQEATLIFDSREHFQDCVNTFFPSSLTKRIKVFCRCGNSFKFTLPDGVPIEDLICDKCGNEVIIYRKTDEKE